MILPIGANTFEEAMEMGSETYHHLKVIRERYVYFFVNFFVFFILTNLFLLLLLRFVFWFYFSD